MRRMIFQADEALLQRLKRRARERGVSEAQVIRDALERVLDPGDTRPDISWVGSVDSGRSDLSERVEEFYRPDPWRS